MPTPRWGLRDYGYKPERKAKAERLAEEPRHKPGTVYACDARNFGADRRLCTLHEAAPEMAEALGWLLPMAEAYLQGAPSHPDHAKLETARALLARIPKEEAR
jgi:hypothetical protein